MTSFPSVHYRSDSELELAIRSLPNSMLIQGAPKTSFDLLATQQKKSSSCRGTESIFHEHGEKAACQLKMNSGLRTWLFQTRLAILKSTIATVIVICHML